jgi:hypothetical protein
MRIIIEVDAEEMTVRTERTDRQPATSVSATPPPAVLRAAAALGASSAGPAPSEVDPATQTDRLSFAATATATPAAEAVDAGAGPFAPPGIAAAHIEEEHDAEPGPD